MDKLHLNIDKVKSFYEAIDFYNGLSPEERDTFKDYVDSYNARGRMLDMVQMRLREWLDDDVDADTALRMINGLIAQYWEKK